MNTESLPIFNAALALPQALRADLAAKLLDSLDDEAPYLPDRMPEEWDALIKSRSDAVHNGETELIDGEVAMAKIRAAIDQASREN